MICEELLKRDPVGSADLLEILRRGSGEILYASKESLILREESGTVFFWAAAGEGQQENARAALPYLPRKGFFCAHGTFCAALVGEHTGCGRMEKCWQARYLGPMPPACPEDGEGVLIRSLDKEDTGQVLANYSSLDDEGYVRERIDSGVMLGAYLGKSRRRAGRLAGFIGLHAEGSIGMLEVLPEYRRHGIAAALVQEMVRRQMQAGAIPFGQIIEGNRASIRLQKKLGFSFAKEFVYWGGTE